MQRNTSTFGAGTAGMRQRFEEKTVRAMRGRERAALEKAQLEGWEVVRQDNGKLQTTLTLRRPRASTSLEALLDRIPVVGGMADAHRPIVFIGVALVVIALIITPMAIMTSGDAEGDAEVAAPTTSAHSDEAASTSSGPSDEAVAERDATELSELEKTQAEDSASPGQYGGPAYEVAEIDEKAVLGEQDQVWVYTDALDMGSADLQDDVKLIVEDVARERGTPNLSVNVVTDREVIAANAVATGSAFTDEYGMEHYVDVVQPKEATAWVAIYTGGMDSDLVQLSTADSAYVLDWWPAGDHESETWKPDVEG